MSPEPRRLRGAVRGTLGAVLGLLAEAAFVGLSVAAALGVAAMVLWVF